MPLSSRFSRAAHLCAAKSDRHDTTPAPQFWTAVNSLHSYDFDVPAGGTYQVQVLWAENGGARATRNWDIAIEGDIALDQVFSNGLEVGGVRPVTEFGVRWTHTVVEDGDGVLSFDFGQIGGLPPAAGDTNYVLAAIIVTDAAVIPEPSTLILAALGLLGLGCCRRRRQRRNG